ncbi:MAG: hypothetical protein LBG06_04865 [Deltaproteobacteria bacterium]|jgi:hypothetical protein|nr:hypothetical protein [Deltaproteobacteria bacterium]
MSDIKTLVIRVDSLAGPAAASALSEGAVFRPFEDGDPPAAHVAGGIPRAGGAADALARLAEGAPIASLALSGGGVQEGLGLVLEESPLRTVIAILAPGALVFHGHGMARGVEGTGPASFLDALPTLAMVGEFLLAPGVEGRVLFQALKNPSYKQGQVGRLKAALARLERVLRRDSQEPWDKHDCA